MTCRILCHDLSGAVSSTSHPTRPGTKFNASPQLVMSDQTVSRDAWMRTVASALPLCSPASSVTLTLTSAAGPTSGAGSAQHMEAVSKLAAKNNNVRTA